MHYKFQGYLHALGMKRTAEVKSAARIGEAEAKRDAGIKVKFIAHKLHIYFRNIIHGRQKNAVTACCLFTLYIYL